MGFVTELSNSNSELPILNFFYCCRIIFYINFFINVIISAPLVLLETRFKVVLTWWKCTNFVFISHANYHKTISRRKLRLSFVRNWVNFSLLSLCNKVLFECHNNTNDIISNSRKLKQIDCTHMDNSAKCVHIHFPSSAVNHACI